MKIDTKGFNLLEETIFYLSQLSGSKAQELAQKLSKMLEEIEIENEEQNEFVLPWEKY